MSCLSSERYDNNLFKGPKDKAVSPLYSSPKPAYLCTERKFFLLKKTFLPAVSVYRLGYMFYRKGRNGTKRRGKSDEALRELLEKAGAESLQSLRGETSDVETVSSEDDVQTFDIVNFILTELEEENKIHCKCPEGTSRTYKFDLVGREHDTVLIYCDTCEASTAVKIGDPIAANAFLHIDELDLN